MNRFSKSPFFNLRWKLFYIFTVYVKIKSDIFSNEGTIAYEMLEIQDMKDLDAILVPISGGGMTAGIAIAAKGINPDIKGIKI